MQRSTLVPIIAAVLAGCASGPPELTPWRADALLLALPPSCSSGAAAPSPDAAAGIVPNGLSVVNSAGAEVLLVAARTCVMAVDVRSGAAEPLPTRGDSIAPTMVDGRSSGVAFSSSLSGSVRVIDTEGAVAFNVSGLRRPLGVRLLPGGLAIVAEYDTGRVTRVGPSDESRPRLIAENLEGPVGLLVIDATRGYVTEARAGRVSSFRFDRYEITPVATGLKQPEGIALLADGRLVVAEVGERRLVAIDPATGDREVMADDLPIGVADDTGGAPGHVTDVAVAPDGSVYLSSDVDRTILRVLLRAPPPQ